MRNPSKVAIVIAIVFLLAWVSDSEPLLAGSDSPTVRIGVLANRGSDRCLSQWVPTAQYLSEKVPDRSFQIIPVEEALLNAWKNGHHAKPGKPITVRWREGNDFQLEVIDNGDGFDPDLIADPTLPINLVKSSGRGIYMIRMFADEIYWRDGGRHLTASFFRRPRPIDANRHGPLNYMDPIWRISNMKKETDTCR